MALEWIKNCYQDIQGIYAKYYPGANEESVKREAYRLLDFVEFRRALRDVWKEFNMKDLDIAKEVIETLRYELKHAKKSADRQNAAIWLGKTAALFTDKQEITGRIEYTSVEKDEYATIKNRIRVLTDNSGNI